MLVKLGDVWVDPTKVVFIEHSNAADKNTISIVTTEGRRGSIGDIDIFASIVNTAGQSFGGEENEKPKEE